MSLKTPNLLDTTYFVNKKPIITTLNRENQ